jgi:hypothetical protein
LHLTVSSIVNITIADNGWFQELGKKWLDVLAEDFEDTMPTFVDSDEEEEE